MCGLHMSCGIECVCVDMNVYVCVWVYVWVCGYVCVGMWYVCVWGWGVPDSDLLLLIICHIFQQIHQLMGQLFEGLRGQTLYVWLLIIAGSCLSGHLITLE